MTTRAYRQANREKIAAYQKAWRAANRERLLGWEKKYREANRQRRLEQKRAWAAKNKERVRAYEAAYRERNLVAISEQKARARKLNAEVARAAVRAWAKANPDRRRVNQQNREAAKRANGGRLSRDIVSKLKRLQRNRCAVCRCELDSAHLDHIVPVAVGGRNDDGNVQLLCPPCNHCKNKKDPVAFMQSRGFLL